jgi:hypothetical protein
MEFTDESGEVRATVRLEFGAFHVYWTPPGERGKRPPSVATVTVHAEGSQYEARCLSLNPWPLATRADLNECIEMATRAVVALLDETVESP